jgi:hypothetical protein
VTVPGAAAGAGGCAVIFSGALLELPDDPCTVTFTLPLIEAAMLGKAGVDTIREVGLTTAGGMVTE